MPNPADVYAGSKLRLQRQVRNMSQSALASALGVTFQQVQKYEKGVTRISASRLQTISRFLGVDITSFFENGDDLPNGSATTNPNENRIAPFLSSKEGVALNRYFVRIKDANQRRAVVSLVKALADMDEE